MNYYAEIKSGKVSSILDTDSEMIGDQFVIIDSHDSTLFGADYDENTGEFTRVTASTHKTKGISAIEWRRLFQPNEPFILDELRANIDNPIYEVPNSAVSLDDPADAINLAITYRQFLRTCFNAFAEATNGGNGIDVEDILTYPSLICFEVFGIIAAGRKDVIIQGVPL